MSQKLRDQITESPFPISKIYTIYTNHMDLDNTLFSLGDQNAPSEETNIHRTLQVYNVETERILRLSNYTNIQLTLQNIHRMK